MPSILRKASTNVLAVDERQSLETLTRDEKTSSRALAQLQDKHDQLEAKMEQLSQDIATQQEKKSEVCRLFSGQRINLSDNLAH